MSRHAKCSALYRQIFVGRALVNKTYSSLDSRRAQLALSYNRRGIWNWLNGRKMVGKDLFGNVYWEVENTGGTPNPRREVYYAEKNLVRVPQQVKHVPILALFD